MKVEKKHGTLYMYYQTCVLIFLFLLSLSLGFEGHDLKMYKTALREFDPDNSI